MARRTHALPGSLPGEVIRRKRLHRFEANVLRTVRERDLIQPGRKVLAAVSGGPDSVALLRSLLAVSPELDATVACCHVHHGLHPDADAHSEFVRGACDGLGVEFHLRHVDVRGRAQRECLSIEHAARLERYGALEAVAEHCGADLTATGHTATDRAETVLLNLFRGTGPDGLCGVPPKRGRIVRPLIDATRAEVTRYLGGRHIEYVSDPTNELRDALRNRIRNEVVPFLEQTLERSVGTGLARLADAALLEREGVEAAVDLLWERAAPRELPGGGLSLARQALADVGRGAATLVLRRCVDTVAGPGQAPNLAQLLQVLKLLDSHTGFGEQRVGACVFVRRRGELLVLPALPGNK